MLEKAEMIVGRRRHILTELRNGVFIATGGSNQAEEVLRDCEAYLMGKNAWIRISSLNMPRFYHTAFSFNSSQLYVVGGCHTNNSSLVNLNSIERIDLSYELNGSWEILSVKDVNLLKPRSRLSYLFIDHNKILLFGGIPDYQAVIYNLITQDISLADNQYNIEGRFFFNDRCTWQSETLFISSQSSRCIFNHAYNSWELKEFNEDVN
jgi:N-acetylneuraminic acid mutarotase